MAGPRLNALKAQFDDVKNGIEKINRSAAAEGRDLTDSEARDLDALFERAETLKPQIEKEASREAGLDAVADVLSRVNADKGPTSIDRAAREVEAIEMTPGQYLAEFYRAYHPQGDSTPDDFLNRAGRYFDRAQQATADTAGIIPVPIIGDVIKLFDARRPLFNALTSRPMPPKGKTFERPFITQQTTAAVQTEGQALSSQKMVVDSDTVTKATYGGYLDLTHQDIDWTEPSALELLVQDFVDVYTVFTEQKAVDFFEALPVAADAANNGDGYIAYTTTNLGTRVQSFVNAVLDVYDRSKRFPDMVAMDLASWGVLAGLTSTGYEKAGLLVIREAFDELGVGPMRWVVSPEMTDSTIIVAASSLLESYEQQKGLLRAETPSTLVVQLAYAGYVAFHGKHEGVVQLGSDPTP